MDNWMKSGNVNFELGLKNILETFIFHKQEVKLMFDDLKQEGYLPKYVNPENFLGNDFLDSQSFKSYEKSFGDLQKYIEDNNIPEGVLKIDELNKDLNNLDKNNDIENFKKEIELMRDKILKLEYPEFDKMNSEEKEKLRYENEAFIDITGISKKINNKELYKKELESVLINEPNFNKDSKLSDKASFSREAQKILDNVATQKILSDKELDRITERVKEEKFKKERDQELAKELAKKDKEKEQEKQEQEQNGMSR